MAETIIGVVGSGTMGGGIAHQAALSGFKVILCDVEDRFLDNAINRMETFMDKSVARGKMKEEQKPEVLGRITTTTNLEDLKEANFVIEAIIENLEAKKAIFSQLDNVLGEEAIIATNTSSMSITVIAGATKRPEKVAGMHFFNPAQIMKLVEVVRGYNTSDDTVSKLMELSRAFGKEPIEVKKDSPGFIVNRIMIPQFIEAIRLAEEGVASYEDIDKAVKLGLNYPMGPFELQDFAGVDIGLHVMDYFYDEFKDSRFAAPQLIRQIVNAGRTGKKAGAGFYDHDKK
ncbi:3-hydroxyacyl-CoA dehydrogenase family protein [Peribacillus butanolivorans]|uniref:3-hydroxyacyl-CoA dehydrogenase family protein n=1 Tax=Peribacillus butanolivorans TaxID=421767 RepID=UPI0037C648F0